MQLPSPLAGEGEGEGEATLSIIRAFVRLREMMGANKEVAAKLGELERKVTIENINTEARPG